MFEGGAKAPLHRLTPLRDDPAVAWLSKGEKLRVGARGWAVWIAFFFSMLVLWDLLWDLLYYAVTPFFPGRISLALVIVLVITIFSAVRRSIIRMKAARVADILHAGAKDVAADDWAALAREPEGQVASVLGWVRGRERLATPLGGESVVGVALPCQSKFPGLLESMHDFELQDEEGRTIVIQMADARTFGTPNVALGGRDMQMLFATLELPTGVTASSYHVHALRDGDPVMVVGFKRMIVDPAAASMRGEGERLALGSSPPCPLLVFSLAAERRPVPS
jgi:hypothetical protein